MLSAVNGNIDLQGAVIASTAPAIQTNKNSLTTETLTVSDIQNNAEYQGKYSSFTAGVGRNTDSQGNIHNSRSASAGMASDSNHASSVTQSVISAGTVNITDITQQTTQTGKDSLTTLAMLNRDVHIEDSGTTLDS